MKYLARLLSIAMIIVHLAGCASGPKYSEMAGTLTPAADDVGRIYIYRTAVLGAAVQPEVRLNGDVVGKATPKGFFYVDVEPGDYKISTSTEVERHLSLAMEKGETNYVRLNINIGFFVGHVYPELVENTVGETEITECSYTGQP